VTFTNFSQSPDHIFALYFIYVEGGGGAAGLMIGVRCCDELMICGDHKPKQTLTQRERFNYNFQDIPQHKIKSINAVETNGVATHSNQLSSMT